MVLSAFYSNGYEAQIGSRRGHFRCELWLPGENTPFERVVSQHLDLISKNKYYLYLLWSVGYMPGFVLRLSAD